MPPKLNTALECLLSKPEVLIPIAIHNSEKENGPQGVLQRRSNLDSISEGAKYCVCLSE